MNLSHVNSREILIIGTGRIPTAEVRQVVKEFAALSDKLVFSYHPLRDEPQEPWDIPTSALTEIEQISGATDFIMYGGALKGLSGWEGFMWGDELLTELEEDDLVVCWLVNDAPDGTEIAFAQSVLDADRPLFVMNEGLWQVDKITDSGLHERVIDSVDDIQQPLAAVEPNLAHLVPEPPGDLGITAEMVKDVEAWEERQTPPPFTGIIDDPADDYEQLSKDDLKRLVVERGIKADKRSVESMIKALTENEAMSGGSLLQFPTAPMPDMDAHPSNGDTLSADEQKALVEEVIEANKDEIMESIAADLLTPHPLMVSSTEGPLPADAVTYVDNRSLLRERLGLIVGKLETMSEHHRELALLTAQLADVMLAMMQEVEGD